MDSTGATNEPCPGILDCAADDGRPVPERMGSIAGWWHSVGNVLFSGWVNGVAATYREPSIVKV